MPIYDFVCQGDCESNGLVRESYLRKFESPDPNCPECGQPMERQIVSRVSVCWARPLGHYDAPGSQMGGDSHVVYRKNSSRSGNPEPVVIDSIQKQREFCRDEGLINPTDLNPNARAGDDGKLATSGVKGQWV